MLQDKFSADLSTGFGYGKEQATVRPDVCTLINVFFHMGKTRAKWNGKSASPFLQEAL